MSEANGHNRKLAQALEYLRRGWAVIPVRNKKALILWEQYQRRLPTEAEVRAWWTADPDADAAVVLGDVSTLVRLDADGPEALEKLEELGGLSKTLSFSTPSGGKGWLFRNYGEGCKTDTVWTGPGSHQELNADFREA
jgi:hypothetical protein